MADEVRTQRGAPDPARGAVERRDLDMTKARLTLVGIAGLVAVVGASVAVLLLLFGAVRDQAPPHPRMTAVPLQIDERGDRARIDSRAAARLAGRDSGVPVAEAMRQTAQAGWDAP